MKKELFSFAVAAVAAVMVSCGNKSAEATEAQAEAAEEQVEAAEDAAEDAAEAAAPAAEKPEPKQFECKYYTCTLPAGRNVELEDEYGIRLEVFKVNEDGTMNGAPQRMELTNPKESYAELMKKWSDKKFYPAGVEKYGDGKCTIDGREFKMVSMAHQVYLISDLKEGGSLMFKMAEYGYEKFPLCKELLNSIKFK